MPDNPFDRPLDAPPIQPRGDGVVRWLVPAGFLLAALLFLLLPAASVSCGTPSTGAKFCYRGAQFFGRPSVTLFQMSGPSDLTSGLADQLAVSAAARVLAVVLLVVLGLGALAAALPGATLRWRALVGFAALGALVLIGTEIVAVQGLNTEAELIAGLIDPVNGGSPPISDYTGTAVGFWVSLLVLVVVGVVSVRELPPRTGD